MLANCGAGAGDVTVGGEVLRVQSVVVCVTQVNADGSQSVRYSFHDRVRTQETAINCINPLCTQQEKTLSCCHKA
jgi:hypothetical protein